MYTHPSLPGRPAFTLIELLVVIAIILAVSALAAAFMPSVQDSQNLVQRHRFAGAMAADGQDAGQARRSGHWSSAHRPHGWGYVLFPGPVRPATGPAVGRYLSADTYPNPYPGVVQFANVDFTLGGLPASEWLVQQGDYLEIPVGGSIYLIRSPLLQPPFSPVNTLLLGSPFQTPTYYTTLSASSAPPPLTSQTWQSTYEQTLSIPTATMNYRIIRQPHPILGESTMQLPGNIAVDLTSKDPGPPPQNYTNVMPTSNVGNAGLQTLDILFSPSGAVVGANASLGKIYLLVHDLTQQPFDPGRAGIVTIQSRTGFIGAYDVGPAGIPYYYAIAGRSSGL